MNTTHRPYDREHPSFRILDTGDFGADDLAIAESMFRTAASALVGAPRDIAFAMLWRSGKDNRWSAFFSRGDLHVSHRGDTSADAVDAVLRVLAGSQPARAAGGTA